MKQFLLLISLLISNHIYAQSKMGLEFSYFGTSTTVYVPVTLSDKIDKVASGPGHFLSFGITIKASEKISLRGGLNFWELAFSPTLKGTVNNQPATATETGSLNYSGIYLRMDRTWPYFFMTGGFDISFSNSYKNNLVIRNAGGTILSQQTGRTESLLTDSFYNQFNLVLGLGPSIPIGKFFKVKGTLSAVVPFSSIYDTGVTVQQVYISNGAPAPDAKVKVSYFPFLSYGIGLEYSFRGNNASKK